MIVAKKVAKKGRLKVHVCEREGGGGGGKRNNFGGRSLYVRMCVRGKKKQELIYPFKMLKF